MKGNVGREQSEAWGHQSATRPPPHRAADACIRTLVDVLDSAIPEPVRDYDAPFLMPIEDVFSVAGVGTVVSGRVDRGVVRAGDVVEIVGLGSDDDKPVRVASTQAFHREVDEARAGMNVGLRLGIEAGMRFAMREGSRTIGAGIVTHVLA